MMFEVIEYEAQYKSDLKKLSYEWLEKYALYEPEDELILENPEEVVIAPGGHIYFVKCGNEIIGTASLIRISDEAYELAKVAVTEQYQGRKIGSMLMEKCIEAAKQEGAKKIILYTNHVLKAAIHLYSRFGFREILQNDKKYMEADMKMELRLQ